MAKQIKFNSEAKQALKKGIDTLADAVKCTLGPKGNCVIITDYSNGKPYVTKDGVTVAKNIELRDKFENGGAALIREASLKTVDTAGDGTTSSTVLAQEFIRLADNFINEGINPIDLKNEINNLVPQWIKNINSFKKEIKEDDIKHIALTSANQDEDVANLLSQIYSEIGKDGIIVVEESTGLQTTHSIVKGIQFERGYESPQFVSDTIKDECVLENPYILLTEHKITHTKALLNILNPIAESHRPLLIIAQDYDDAVIENFKLNHLQGIIKCCLVKCPVYREYRHSYMQDIAVVTNSTLIDYESGLELKDITLNHLGTCRKVVVNKDFTTIIEGSGFSDEINYRAEELKAELKRVEQDPGMDGSFMQKFLKQRIAQLLGGLATIKVGGVTELEMKERKDRIDDAVCATKAAFEDGIVPGCGNAYIIAISKIKDDNSTGYQLLKEGCSIICKTILKNAGITDVDVEHIKNPITHGIDAVTGKYVNLIKHGIIDPSKVVKEAFVNAISVLNLYLSTACIIAPELEIIY